MLYPVAGSRFHVADAPGADPATVAPDAWIEVGETEALGLIGGSWQTGDSTNMESPRVGGLLVRQNHKEILDLSVMQIVLGNDPADPGQIILWKAFRFDTHFPFRIVFTDGATARSWSALVTAFSEVFDEANRTMKMMADLQPTTLFQRSEGE